MKKSLLVLLVLIMGACSVTPEDEKEPTPTPTPKTFGEIAQGIYTIEGQKLELKIDGHLYDGDTIIYTMVEDKGDGKAVYSVITTTPTTVTKYFGLSVTVTGETKTLTFYKKSETEYWDLQPEVSFDPSFSQGDLDSIPEGGGENDPLDPTEAKVFIDKVNNAKLSIFDSSGFTAFPEIPANGTIELEIDSEKKEFKLAHLRNEIDAIFTNGTDANISYIGITFRKNTLDLQDKIDSSLGYTKDNISWSKTREVLALKKATPDEIKLFANKINAEGFISAKNGNWVDFDITKDGTYNDQDGYTYTIGQVINKTSVSVAYLYGSGGSSGIEIHGLKDGEYGILNSEGTMDTVIGIKKATPTEIVDFVKTLEGFVSPKLVNGNWVDLEIVNGAYNNGTTTYKIGKFINPTTVLVAYDDDSGNTGTETHGLVDGEYGILNNDGLINTVIAFKTATATEMVDFVKTLEGFVYSQAVNGNWVDFVITAGAYSDATKSFKIRQVLTLTTVLVAYDDGLGNTGTETHGLIGKNFGILNSDNTMNTAIAVKKATIDDIKAFAGIINDEGLSFFNGADFVEFVIAENGTYNGANGAYKIGQVMENNTVLVTYDDGFGNISTETHGLRNGQYGSLDNTSDTTVNDLIAFKKSTTLEIAKFAGTIDGFLSVQLVGGNWANFIINIADGTYSDQYGTYKIGKVINPTTVLVARGLSTQIHGLIGTEFGRLDNTSDTTVNDIIAFKKSTPTEIVNFVKTLEGFAYPQAVNGNWVDLVISDGTYTDEGNIYTYDIGKVSGNTVLVAYKTGGNSGTERHGLINGEYGVLNPGGTMKTVLAFKKVTTEEIATFAKKLEGFVSAKNGNWVDLVITADGTYTPSRVSYKIGKVINPTTVLVAYIDRNETITEKHGIIGKEFGDLNPNTGTIWSIQALKKSTPTEIEDFAKKLEGFAYPQAVNGNWVDLVISDGTYTDEGNIYTYDIGKVSGNTVLVAYKTGGNSGTERHGLINGEYGVLNPGGTMKTVLAFKKVTTEEIATFAKKLEGFVSAKNGNWVDLVITADGTYTPSRVSYKIGKVINPTTVLVAYIDRNETITESHGVVGKEFGKLNPDNGTIRSKQALKKSTPTETAKFISDINAEGLNEVRGSQELFVIRDGAYSDQTYTYKIGPIIDANTVWVLDGTGNFTSISKHGLRDGQYGRLNNTSDTTVNNTIAFKKSTPREIANFINKINALSLIDYDRAQPFIIAPDGTYQAKANESSSSTYTVVQIKEDYVLVSFFFGDSYDIVEKHGFVDGDYGRLDYDDSTMMGRIIGIQKSIPTEIATFAKTINDLPLNKVGTEDPFIIADDGTYGEGLYSTYEVIKVINSTTVYVTLSYGTVIHGLRNGKYGSLDHAGATSLNKVIAE